jgi:molybdenum cofactor sulfurtransferase
LLSHRYPTGLGALIVSKRGANNLMKKYYGGGTVKIALTRTNWHQKRDELHEKFEDGTIDFLSIISLQPTFSYFEQLLGKNFIDRISKHTHNLAKYVHEKLKALKYNNDKPIAILYHDDTDYKDISEQGSIVNFNLIHPNGNFIGFAEFSCMAALHKLVLRTGCFCNPGSCQTHLKLTNEEIMKQFHAGHVCGDENDLIDGTPTGSIRVSFGYMNTKEDADKLLYVIEKCYMENNSTDFLKKDVQLSDGDIEKIPLLKSMRIFPIKSCGPMVIAKSWILNKQGLKYDREWMIVNGRNGTSLTQKNETKMCLITPSIDEMEGTLTLHFPHHDPIKIPLSIEEHSSQINATMCETKVCGDRIKGYDCGNEVAEWLSNVLMTDDLRLIRQSADNGRKNGDITLVNQAQFLLINELSVVWLMSHVKHWDSSEDVDNIVDRFRGNLIVENAEALTENQWKSVVIGGCEFIVQGPCTRCQMICIDQSSGEKTTEPLRTIGKLFKGKTRFGIYLKLKSFKENVTLTCGDEIYPSNGEI